MQGFQTFKQLQNYTEKHGRFQDGDVMEIHDENKIYVFKDKEWHELKTDSNIQMNLYDLNKQLMSQMNAYTLEQWEEAETNINNWEANIKATYYMMLCKEISYYTVFVNDGYEFHSLGAAVRECLEFIGGDIVSIDIEPEVIEIWVKQTDDVYCLHLFNYDNGIVSFKR